MAVAVGIIGAVAAVASTAISIKAQNDAAEMQIDSEKKSYAAKQNQSDVKAQEVNNQSTQAQTEIRKNALQERARVRVSQSEGGLSGLSMDRLMGLSELKEETNVSNLKHNTEGQLSQLHMDSLGMRAQSQGSINNANSRITGGGMAALQIGLNGISSGTNSYVGAGGTFS